ncbi:HTH-type transcriptional regulator / antitoxin HigA [Frankia sp. AiPs1]|uniref:ImmA/IrrE family metallo-endopeptidase n=1 Tax=Frankia sp. AiPa1 TaxID=573492 RepID=UPI00202ADF96|nr:ImmA/IrrE family metallo-endopeptidase [Frankia sp. AiPa1]MCL9761763.1 ImmA/IrrE family metallo-endopeptidase [Frankia sp. AiPa1]
MRSIGERVLEQIRQARPAEHRQDIAREIGMTPDAFSRALNGRRAFSSIELAHLADLLDADLHWMITGRPDPYRLVVAARHTFDHATGRREVPARDADQAVLEDIALAYRQAFPERRRLGTAASASSPLPSNPGEVRAALGADFVRPFAERLEARLGVGVVRFPGLSTAYSLAIGGHRVIVLPGTGNWFRENWSLAHELGHLALRHHEDGVTEAERNRREAAANAFAADLLLPHDELAAVEWASVDAAGLAALVWRWGVSTDALARRLSAIHEGPPPPLVVEWAGQKTQRLLRRHWRSRTGEDEITPRMQAAARRRFPLELTEAHLAGIASGALGKETLAWMLGVNPDAVEVDMPSVPDVSIDDLAGVLGI